MPDPTPDKPRPQPSADAAGGNPPATPTAANDDTRDAKRNADQALPDSSPPGELIEGEGSPGLTVFNGGGHA